MTWLRFVQSIRRTSGRWVYRGGLGHWRLETSLERTCAAWRIPLRHAAALEHKLAREFERHPEIVGHIIRPEDYLERLALMQHHGAPTRLLDWTYSPYIAAFFAFESLLWDRSNRRDVRATVWALDIDWLERRLREKLTPDDWALYTHKKDGKSFKQLFVDRTPRVSFIGTATPRALNQRLSVQQGLFLCPGDVTRSWQENLDSLAEARRRPQLRAFKFPRSSIKTAFSELGAMNVTARSLFPGIDGYARSMGARAYQVWKTPVLAE